MHSSHILKIGFDLIRFYRFILFQIQLVSELVVETTAAKTAFFENPIAQIQQPHHDNLAQRELKRLFRLIRTIHERYAIRQADVLYFRQEMCQIVDDTYFGRPNLSDFLSDADSLIGASGMLA